MGSSGDEERSELHDQSDKTAIRFQELFGARLFRQGRPRAVLEVKSAQISIATYEARLRGYDEAKAADESAPRRKTKARAKRRTPPKPS